MKRLFKAFVLDTSGATAIEYALIAGGIALVILAAITNTSTGIGTKYNNMANSVNNALQ